MTLLDFKLSILVNWLRNEIKKAFRLETKTNQKILISK